MIATLSQRFGEVSADARTGTRYQDRPVIVRNGGVRCREKNNRGGQGERKLEKSIHDVSFLLFMAVTLAQSKLPGSVLYRDTHHGTKLIQQ